MDESEIVGEGGVDVDGEGEGEDAEVAACGGWRRSLRVSVRRCDGMGTRQSAMNFAGLRFMASMSGILPTNLESTRLAMSRISCKLTAGREM